MNQIKAYIWLSEKLNMTLEFTNFGMFSIEQCKEALGHCKNLSRF